MALKTTGLKKKPKRKGYYSPERSRWIGKGPATYKPGKKLPGKGGVIQPYPTPKNTGAKTKPAPADSPKKTPKKKPKPSPVGGKPPKKAPPKYSPIAKKPKPKPQPKPKPKPKAKPKAKPRKGYYSHERSRWVT